VKSCRGPRFTLPRATVRRVTADPQGRIWIARTARDFGPRGTIDIVRASGSYISSIENATLPAAVSTSGRAAFIERDDVGLEHVIVKMLPAASTGMSSRRWRIDVRPFRRFVPLAVRRLAVCGLDVVIRFGICPIRRFAVSPFAVSQFGVFRKQGFYHASVQS
jgi:hypothetical protein